MSRVLVIDIGKTNAKLALVDPATLAETAFRATPNRPLPGPPYPHADVEGLWAFILAGIRDLGREGPIEAIVTATHGAAAALVDAGGGLALPVLDYEHPGPDSLASAYDDARPPFADTGSPRLPLGLNLGAQLFWQARAFPEAFAGVAAILPYPQYWTWRLCGVAAAEPTSLGCHTDLWNPAAGGFSALAESQGWARLFPPLRRAGAVLGAVTAEIAAATGLDPTTPVLCGLHDSNAALLPHLAALAPPFAVVSTGTWVIAMAVGGRAPALDPARDTLVNVDAFGAPVPSARFMGGREWEIATRGRAAEATEADLAAVLARGVMLLPAVEPGSGPFQGRAAAWSVDEARLTDGERAAAVSFCLALTTAACLDVIGAEGPVIVEGPFARNAAYLRMLAAGTGRPVRPATATSASAGAAILAGATPPPAAAPGPAAPEPALAAYAAAWRAAVG